MQLFTVHEACELSGLNAQTLRNWVATGLLRPARPGTTGTGNDHRFSLVQVLALAAGVRHRLEGAGPERAAGVVHFLAGLTAERLEADFERGLTFPVPAALVQRAAGGRAFRGTSGCPGCWSGRR